MNAATRLALLGVIGCSSACLPVGRSHVPANVGTPKRVAVMIVASVGEHRSVQLFDRVRPMEWSNAAFMHFSLSANTGSTFATPDRTPGAVMIMANHRRAATMRMDAVSPGRGGVIPESPLIDSWARSACDTTAWVSAFFIEGLGYRPNQPVIIKYEDANGSPTMRVDPTINTVNIKPFHVLKSENVSTAESRPSKMEVRVAVDRSIAPSMLLVLEKRGSAWRGSGFLVSTRSNNSMGLTQSYDITDSNQVELQFYLLRDYSVCDAPVRSPFENRR